MAAVDHHDEQLYRSWLELIGWMRGYATEKGVRFEKEADFPDFIYRMERPYEVPTTIMSASLSDGRGEPFLICSVSPRHVEMKHIALRVPGGHIHWHAHHDGKHLVAGKIALSHERFVQMADRAYQALAVKG
jgi:hypothetical protein